MVKRVTLTTLSLPANTIGDAGATALAEALAGNASLQLKNLIVLDGLERHAQLKCLNVYVARVACAAKLAQLVAPRLDTPHHPLISGRKKNTPPAAFDS